MQPTTLKLGTRGSELALVQAHYIKELLEQRYASLEIEIKIIHTTGDKRTDVALNELAKISGMVDKGVFIKELEVALADGSIDFAVHSLKDMPSVLEEQFVLAAVSERESKHDVLISKFPGGLKGLPEGSVVGTSSVRRQRLLGWLRPDLSSCEWRGNVPTRINKLMECDQVSAIILAAAGINRLGYSKLELERMGEGLYLSELDSMQFLPAAGQAAIGLETLKSNSSVRQILAGIGDDQCLQIVSAERMLLALLKAGCHTPLGINCQMDEHNNLHAKVCLFDENNNCSEPKVVSANAPSPRQLAEELYAKLKS